ncbi:S8 family serine peptidase [uncultured Tessaracoccus sp.]|uniref:S8 family serine peptidase n=1 Tax=uncultured Tessaracoccus sp. TaxID=905023 RepID=UPI0025DC4CB2|nr:S8 family serine peptidase [uncultured Tessaracoccus sp.]
MSRRVVRWLSACVAGMLLLTQQALNASAGVTPFDPGECHVAAKGTAAPQTSWHFQRLQMDRVWKVATGRGVTVAVIDTGVSTTGSLYMQAAADKRFTAYDLLDGRKSDGNQQLDEFDCLHGTRVTSLLAAGRGSDGKPIDGRVEFSGIAPDAKVLTYRSLMQSEVQEDSEPMPLQPTTEAVLDAVARKVDVINLSQVVPETVEGFEGLRDAIQLAINRGIVVVAAAGNNGQMQGMRAFPASFPGVISVGATNRNDAASSVSQAGAKVDVGAPGEGIVALDPSHHDSVRGVESQVYSPPIAGTSFATPIVSGVVALMIEKQRDDGLAPLTPAEVRQRLIETADPPPAAVPDPALGAGIVNPLRVLSGEVPQLAPNEQADTTVLPKHYPPEAHVDSRPAVIGIVMGIVAVMLVVAGIVATLVIPAARRVSREDRGRA